MLRLIYFLLLFQAILILQACNEKKPGDQSVEYYSSADFKKIVKIDAHVHINSFDTTLLNLARSYGFRLISLNVGAPEYPTLEKQQRFSLFHLRQSRGDFAYTTSFTMNGFDSANWQEQQLNYLAASFDSGAVGVKVWKHIGMELKDQNGGFIMIDHPRFDTLFKFIQEKNKTLVGHLGEPRNCWLPLEKMTVKNDRDYFSKHPEYHMFLHPEFPSYENQIQARNNLLKKHPALRFDGAHLGSLEWSVDEMAKHLDSFPNMALDMAERISHLQYQSKENRQKVIDFISKYQDRLIYATDIYQEEGADLDKLISYASSTWEQHWMYFSSDKMMEAPEIEGSFQALHLPKTIIDKIYRHNTEKWFPDAFVKTP
jgi:hypothetical protein